METKPHKTIFLILVLSSIIWFSSSSEKKVVTENLEEGNYYKPRPALLGSFIPPALVVFKDSENTLPKRNWQIPALELQTEAALAMRPDGGRIYYNKNMEARRPIASLTKLMTAIIVLENYDLNEIIKVLKSDIEKEGSQGNLRPAEELTIRSLLNIMLIDSSNDAASALARQRPDFVSLMNQKVKKMRLNNTHFTNADGLDEENNYSSTLDIAKIFNYLTSNYPDTIEILKTRNMVVFSSDGNIAHRLQNTNELLNRIDEIISGKTGYTDRAGGSLILLLSGLSFGSENNIITVVLGSLDRFGESEKLVKWLKAAYIWN